MSRSLGFTIFALLALAVSAPLATAGDDPTPDTTPTALESRFKTLDKSDVTAAYKLALELEAAGADALARKAYEIVVGIDGDHAAARRALGYEKIADRWLQGDDLQRAKGFVRHDNKWMTAEAFAAATRPQREAKAQKAGEARVLGMLAMIASGVEAKVAKAKRLMAMEPARFKLAPLAKALRCEPPALRIYAARELGRLGDPLGAPALLKRVIYDDEKPVRVAMAEALKEIGVPSTVHPLGRALDSRFRDVRVRAAEALGILGDELAYAYVIKKWEGRSGNFPRSYFSNVRQISYIQDFDVEVAQTSFIADPIVGVLSDGVVQSVKIHATEQSFTIYERPAFNGALKSLAGTDLGNKVGAWKSFWKQNKERLLEERDQRYTALAVARKEARAKEEAAAEAAAK